LKIRRLICHFFSLLLVDFRFRQAMEPTGNPTNLAAAIRGVRR
jgi:hypothetical protein